MLQRLVFSFLIGLLSSIAVAGPEPDVIGKVKRLQGWAVETPLGLTHNTLSVGSPIHETSTIKTGKDARLEIEMADGSILQLGAWAFVNMESYGYRRSPERITSKNIIAPVKDEQRFKVVGGAFRFISGLIAKRNPKSVRITTPVATLGIRGTELFGGAIEAGMPKGEIHYGFMIIEGAIDVINDHGNVTLDDPGDGTFLPMKGHKAPLPPAKWDEQMRTEAFGLIEFR